jgi:hypothetical protein
MFEGRGRPRVVTSVEQAVRVLDVFPWIVAELVLAIPLVLTAIPLVTVALIKAERSPRPAALVHAVMFKQSGRRFLHVRRVLPSLRKTDRIVAHLSLRSRMDSISAIRRLMALTGSSLPVDLMEKIALLSITARSSRKFDSSNRSSSIVGSSLAISLSLLHESNAS